jgi:hypothetical protein
MRFEDEDDVEHHQNRNINGKACLCYNANIGNKNYKKHLNCHLIAFYKSGLSDARFAMSVLFAIRPFVSHD